MAGLISTTSFFEVYNGNAPTLGYSTNLVFPTTNLTILSVTYYDNYDFKSLIAGTVGDYSPGELAGQDTAPFDRVHGQVTGGQVNVLGSTSYLWSVNYYDKKYRLIQSKSVNHKSGVDIVTNKYDFVRLLETKTTHVNGGATYTTKRRMTYDHAGRIKQLWHTFHNQPEVLLEQNSYNELGQLTTKKLHSRNSGGTFAQATDYKYTIRGWLSAINDIDAPEPSDLFSMKLNYNKPTASGGAMQHNGNISEILWATAGSDKQSYGYSYDNMNRLLEANYYNTTRPINNGRYDEKIKGPNQNISPYDLNGNIKFLERKGKHGTAYGELDKLIYTYASGNQLVKVVDDSSSSIKAGGFFDGTNSGNDYTYDRNGNMTKDENKGITAITYNHLNLPVQVNKGSSNYIVYTYDASGKKLKQQVFGATPKTTDYIGEYVYENNVLKLVMQEEGRIVPDNSAGAPRPFEYQYFLKDHLGNVRVTFSEKKTSAEYKADMEAPANNAFFKYINRTGFAFGNHTTGGTYSQILNAGDNGRIGLSKSLIVNPGDVVDMEVYAKYEEPQSQPGSTVNFEGLLINAFGITAGGATPLDGQAALTGFQNAFTGSLFIGGAGPPHENASAPHAYLNYILFDENFNMVDFGFDQIASGATTTHDLLNLHIKIWQKGFLYIYLSNEQTVQTNVYFDDFKIVHNTGVEQTSDYYPFGLTFNDFLKQNTIQDYMYNGKEQQNELGLGWLDYGARMYVPELGRWNAIDPLTEKFNTNGPYNYVLNNPLIFFDPDGRDLIFTGLSHEEKVILLKIINQGLQGQFAALLTKVKGTNDSYSLTLVATKEGKLESMTDEGKAFYNRLSNVITDKEKIVSIEVVFGESSVKIGRYETSQIDIADIDQYNPGGLGTDYSKPTGQTKQGKLIHEVTEQYEKSKGVKFGRGGTSGAHGEGIKAEDEVNGNRRLMKRLGNGEYQDQFFTEGTSGILQQVKEKDGSVTTIIYKHMSPVIKPTQTNKKN